MALVAAETVKIKQHYHHTFEIKKNSKTIMRHTLLQNPQNITQAEQARTSVTQTIGGAYILDYGAGLPTVTLSGTTGYKRRVNEDGQKRDGYQEFIHFRNEIYRKFVETNDPDYELYWYNWEDKDYWSIQPTVFRLQRSVSEPLLYRYEFGFTCLARIMSSNAAIRYTKDTVDFNAVYTDAATAISNVSEALSSFSQDVTTESVALASFNS